MTEGMNPWVTRPIGRAPATVTATAPLVPRPTGPTAPQQGIPVPDQVDQLPVVDRSRQAGLWWLGTHGGAGESSLAGLVPEWAAAEHAWPRVQGQRSPARVILTARSNFYGLTAARNAARHWAAGGLPFAEIVGLVVVADAPGRLPRPLRDLIQVVGGGVPRVWEIPWIESWRLGETPVLDTAPRAVRRLADELQAIHHCGADGTVN